MLKKIILGVLLLTVLGAAGAAIAYQATNPEIETQSDIPVLESQISNDTQEPQPVENIQIESTPTPAAEQVIVVEQPFSASGTITGMDDYGITLQTDSGESIYVELGPSTYWQAQENIPQTGQFVSIEGTAMDEMYHASTISFEDGQILALRTDTNQPLWSGGANNEQGQIQDGSHTPDPQAQVDEWLTIEGSLVSYQGGYMTMSTSDGALLSFQTGQPMFFASQGVSFNVGEAISVMGYYQDGQFMAGDITQTATGLRVFLRDTNGRPLWSGPGNSEGSGGNGNGNGNAGGGGKGFAGGQG